MRLRTADSCPLTAGHEVADLRCVFDCCQLDSTRGEIRAVRSLMERRGFVLDSGPDLLQTLSQPTIASKREGAGR